MGATLPEAVKATGAVGVMLNHAEHKLTPEERSAALFASAKDAQV